MSWTTADLSDAHPEAQVLAPLWQDFGGRGAFHGPIATVKVFEDNALVRLCLEQAGADQVLVIDGGGSLRCALVGGMLAELAVRNRWAGILVFGCVRDCAELAAQPVGIKALAAHPRKSNKGLHAGNIGSVLQFADAVFRPGEWLYADADGVLLLSHAVHGGNAA